MKRIVLGLLMLLFASVSIYSANGIGIIRDEDFRAVGVSQKNIDSVKKIIEEASVQYKIKTLDKKGLEIEINKYILEGTEKNIDKLNELLDKVGLLESEMIKDRLKYQIEVRKYISTEEYIKARELTLQRLSQQKN